MYLFLQRLIQKKFKVTEQLKSKKVSIKHWFRIILTQFLILE